MNAQTRKLEKAAAWNGRSQGALAAHLRGGAGKHDPRPNRQRTRATSLRAALRDS